MITIKRLFLILIALIALLVLYLLFWPVPISPQAWTPPEEDSRFWEHTVLMGVERLSLGSGFAPEDVAVDEAGRIYGGLDDGRIMRLKPDGTSPELFALSPGRPLGMKFDQQGNLIVADADKGLLSIARDGAITVLTTSADGKPLRCTNDLDVAADGTIYFTDATTFPISNYKADILEHGLNGRLLAFDPKTQTTRTILGNLSFANGVAISPDQSFVLVNETAAYRIHRVWLTGPKSGQSEIFIENLPGFPDGISSNGKDKFWLAIVSPRDRMLDRLLPHPWLRKVVWRMPRRIQPAPKRYSYVLRLDSNARVVTNLQNGSPECYAQIANVVEHEGFLYFGSIAESTVGRYRLIPDR